MKSQKFILITGLMGSGKSTIISEYMYEHDTDEFTRPPVDAKFRGMDFQFIDGIFAIKKDNTKYNFYELDAPTINKWNQFIKIADAVILVYNYDKTDYFESKSKFINNIKKNISPDVPIYFVVNSCDNNKDAEAKLENEFSISQFNNPSKIYAIPKGEIYFTKEEGKRIKINLELVEKLYADIIEYVE